MKIILNNQEYSFLTGYQKDQKLRDSFNKLASDTFGISFESWYQAGYWNEYYIPYTLFNSGVAVASASVNVMDFNVFGKQQRYIQIGTVMTDPGFRNQHLNRFLMGQILNEWSDKCDLIYLYANKSVLDLYPKYGFKQTKEYCYSKIIENKSGSPDFIKLNMASQDNKDKLYKYAKNSAPFGSISLHENADLVMFYCAFFMKDWVHHIKSLDIIAIADIKDGNVHLIDMFGKRYVEPERVAVLLSGNEKIELSLGFTPQNFTDYDVQEISGDDTLFIKSDKLNPFDNCTAMFPVLSHA